MTDAHDRYDELAVGHVLGGLDPVDAAEFRSHLVGCRNCRLRVAELRDLASELAAAEREERAAARVQTQVRNEDGEEDADDAAPERGPLRGSLPFVALVAAVVLAAGFWVFQLRDHNDTLLAATEQRETTLAMLAEAERLEAEFADGVTGIVVADDEEFALTVSGMPTLLPDGHVLVVWLVGTSNSGDEVVRAITDLHQGGRLALHAPHKGAQAVLVTAQPPSPEGGPAGRELVRAPLDQPPAQDRRARGP
ncbi:MAG: zf-HC2 domain-containing protein [Nitriliruptorales bacterium]|nr:zf-HC2 domain-containing protein [Nitriliruptorales bacterium]